MGIVRKCRGCEKVWGGVGGGECGEANNMSGECGGRGGKVWGGSAKRCKVSVERHVR